MARRLVHGVITAMQIIETMFFLKRLLILSGMSLTLFSIFLKALQKKEVYFKQGNATAHAAKYCIVLNEVYAERLISQRLWPAVSPNFNPCDFLCRET
jgi:hypothetical protein